MNEIELTGLQGHNPLAFLAALGVLRTASALRKGRPMRMHWVESDGGWCPVLLSAFASPDELAESVHEALLSMRGHPAFGFADDLTIDGATFRGVAREAATVARPDDRVFADFIAGFAADGLPPDDPKVGRIQDTGLRTMSGAGHQHFLGFMRELVDGTTVAHLRSSLFERWSYTDEKPSLRWDPQDDRRYALRWREPSGDPVRTMRGANRLAIEAIPLLPTFPVGSKLATTAFRTWRRVGTFLTWPIWTCPASVDSVRSLLASSELRQRQPDRSALTARGVVEVFRSQRITQGKYRNFTPAEPA